MEINPELAREELRQVTQVWKGAGVEKCGRQVRGMEINPELAREELRQVTQVWKGQVWKSVASGLGRSSRSGSGPRS